MMKFKNKGTYEWVQFPTVFDVKALEREYMDAIK
jgi:hypothetical protein